VADLRTDLHAYRVILAARMRAQTAYRVSFATDVLGTLGVGLTELAEVYVIFHNVPLLGGLTFAQALMVFALANIAYSLADMVVGHLDTLPTYIRAGTVDAFYLRPLPLLAQLVTSDISLRRLGRLGVALVTFAIAVHVNEIDWSARTTLVVAMAVVAGVAIVAALFVCASALQFFLVEGGELTNGFVYGGAYASQNSTQVFPGALRVLFTYVVPAAFVAYLPTVVLLDLPGAPLLPSWLGWCAPLAAALAWAVALLLWRAGTHRYQGAGG
jgi:viologen exporter family transport system permease protein